MLTVEKVNQLIKDAVNYANHRANTKEQNRQNKQIIFLRTMRNYLILCERTPEQITGELAIINAKIERIDNEVITFAVSSKRAKEIRHELKYNELKEFKKSLNFILNN